MVVGLLDAEDYVGVELLAALHLAEGDVPIHKSRRPFGRSEVRFAMLEVEMHIYKENVLMEMKSLGVWLAISLEQQSCRVSRELLGAKRRPRRAMNIAAGYRG